MKFLTYIKGNHVLQAFLINFGLFAISYLTIGWWTNNYQHMFDTALSGELSNYYWPAAYNAMPEYLPGASYVLNWLGKIYPIRWIAFFLNGILFISLWVIFYHILSNTKTLNAFNKVLLIGFFSFLFLESVVLYHMVRITMFAGIASLTFILLNDTDKYFDKRNLPYFLLFLIAIWIRGNVHLFLLLFLTVAFLLHQKSIKPLVPYFIGVGLFFCYHAGLAFVNPDNLHLTFLYNYEFKLHFAGQYKADLQLTHPLDTIKYKAIKHDILADETNLQPEFYKRIGIFSNYSRFSVSQFFYALKTFTAAIKENIYLSLGILTLVISYIVLGGKYFKRFHLRSLLLILSFYAIIFAICFIKMENRFLVPFHVLFILTFVFLYKPNFIYHKRYAKYFALFLLVFIPFSSYFIAQNISFAKEQHESFKKSYRWLGKKFKDDIIVFNTVFITWNRPFETFYQRNYFDEFYLYNYYTNHLSRAYRPYIENKCNCDVGKFYTFYKYLANKQDRVIIVDDKKRVKVLSDYLKKVHHINLRFEPIDMPKSIKRALQVHSFYNNLGLYQLKKKSET